MFGDGNGWIAGPKFVIQEFIIGSRLASSVDSEMADIRNDDHWSKELLCKVIHPLMHVHHSQSRSTARSLYGKLSVEQKRIFIDSGAEGARDGVLLLGALLVRVSAFKHQPRELADVLFDDCALARSAVHDAMNQGEELIVRLDLVEVKLNCCRRARRIV